MVSAGSRVGRESSIGCHEESGEEGEQLAGEGGTAWREDGGRVRERRIGVIEGYRKNGRE